MEKPFKPTKKDTTPKVDVEVDPSAIKGQFAQIQDQQGQQPLTPEQQEAARKDHEKWLDSELPYLEKLVKYKELQQKLLALACRYTAQGEQQLRPEEVGGTLGKQLEAEAMVASQQWVQLKMQQNEMMKRAAEEKKGLDRRMEQEKDKERDVTVVFDKEYQGIAVGKEYIINKAQDIECEITVVGTTGATKEKRKFAIHRLEDEGIVHIVR